jgi:hypothetical protein
MVRPTRKYGTGDRFGIPAESRQTTEHLTILARFRGNVPRSLSLPYDGTAVSMIMSRTKVPVSKKYHLGVLCKNFAKSLPST